MSRRTIARVIAVLLLAYACAFLLVAFDKEEMVTYRALSHDALIAKLAEAHDGSFDTNFLAGVVIIGMVVLCADALTALVALSIDRISPPEPAAIDSVTRR